MAEKSDDIKNLFMNLGLNPSDYHEIRSAPTANATVSEAPRRWSLLQAAQPLRNLNVPAVPPTPIAAPAPPQAFAEPATLAPPLPIPPPAPAIAPAAMPPMASALPSALLAAAEDIARAEVSRGAPPSRAKVPVEQPPTVEPLQSALPSSLSAAFVEPVPADGLQSLFQSVKEPQTAAVAPIDAPRYAERRTDQLHHTPASSSPAARAAAMSAMSASSEPETRYAAPPQASRLGPVPTPVSGPSSRSELPPAAASPVKLKFGAAASESAVGNGESLQDVFRRLSRDNRG